MLTLKQIEEQRDFVVSRLAVKHVKNAEETVDRIIELNRLRRQMQAQNDAVLCELNQTSKSIGMLLKNGKTDEADEAKKHTGELKAATAELDRKMAETAQQIQDLLVTLPNLPHISVPEGYGAEDNVVVRMGGKMPELPEGALPHWELARKYDIIDFELGVKLTGA
ncbi:MAG: serine--tRNA ligase, partial [Bacteroidales bacterium]|nr:serine--tRNA ligase [Bacteroidales bacterium]